MGQRRDLGAALTSYWWVLGRGRGQKGVAVLRSGLSLEAQLGAGQSPWQRKRARRLQVGVGAGPGLAPHFLITSMPKLLDPDAPDGTSA